MTERPFKEVVKCAEEYDRPAEYGKIVGPVHFLTYRPSVERNFCYFRKVFITRYK